MAKNVFKKAVFGVWRVVILVGYAVAFLTRNDELLKKLNSAVDCGG